MSKRTTTPVTVVATATSPLDAATLMQRMFELPLPDMFTAWSIFPAVQQVDFHDIWDHVGAKRDLTLARNGHITEELVRYTPGQGWTHHLTDFKNSLEPLAKHVDDDWVFEDAPGGAKVTWTWTFHASPVQRLTAPLQFLWGAYMRHILQPNVDRLSSH